jgi:ribosomal protein S18 acetylase RimI-like enzyme
MSLFGEYIQETQGREIIEVDYGFATYIITGTQVYIEDIYIRPEFRKSAYASKLADKVKERAMAQGCTDMVGTVNCTFKDPTTALKALLGYGFKIHKVVQDVIVMKMEI